MKSISLLYDKNELKLDIPFDHVEVLQTKKQVPQEKPSITISNALKLPLAGKKIPALCGKSIAVAINDQTRPLPHNVILPILLEYLAENGAESKSICFFIATGTHRKLTEEEIEQILPGDLAQRYTYTCHDCDNLDELVYLGDTTAATPVYVNRAFYQSDVKILVGNIEPHHFMGFSGGYKTAAIGLAGRMTIEKNHAMLTDPRAKMGLFLDNPMRNDLENIGSMIGVDYALNVVLNDDKEILHAFWGDPRTVMETGIPYALACSRIDKRIEDCQYDLVIASAGGFPKDINLYQAQKALTNACLFSKKNGVVILFAGCRQGAGNAKFMEYVRNKATWKDVLADFTHRKFEIGPHKAFQLALQAKEHNIILVSEIPAAEAKTYFVTPAADLSEALSLAAPNLPENCRVAILPYATHSMPTMEGI